MRRVEARSMIEIGIARRVKTKGLQAQKTARDRVTVTCPKNEK
jgi:hypothetical protein